MQWEMVNDIMQAQKKPSTKCSVTFEQTSFGNGPEFEQEHMVSVRITL